MEVIDARQAFHQRNAKYFDELISRFDPVQQSALTLIPLVFHINHRLLPGFNGVDTPAGIYGYKPDESLISQARQMNNRFNYEQETLLRNPVIDAIYLQHDAVDDELNIWIVHIPTLAIDEYELLNDKLQRILVWLQSRDIGCQGQLLTADQLADAVQLPQVAKKYVCSGLFIELFYLQACLLAGKYPLWWLVPPEKEQDYAAWVAHIKSARYVNNNEYMDLGGIADVSQDDLLRQGVRQVQGVYRNPESSWLRLLLLAARTSAWPHIEGPGWRLKSAIYEGTTQQDSRPLSILTGLIHDAIERGIAEHQLLQPSRIFASLGEISRESGRQLFQHLSRFGQQQQMNHQRNSVDVSGFITLYKALFQRIRQTFGYLVSQYEQYVEDGESQQQLNALAHNLMVYLSTSDNRVSIYNTHYRAEFVIGRMILRQQQEMPAERQWSLVLEMDEGQQHVIDSFSNLLSLLAWAWLNRLVDQSTQISLDCPTRMVRQIEARHVLEVLIQQLDPERLMRVDQQAFELSSRPMRSLLFVNLMVGEQYRRRMESAGAADPLLYETADDLVVNCEQLVINSWGDVHCQQYTGNQGILQCLCDWTRHVELKPGSQPAPIYCYGYAAGVSTFWAQRIAQVYDEMVQFFYRDRKYNGRFIIRMGAEYFLIEAIDGQLGIRQIGSQARLYNDLEQASEEFRLYGLERYALTDTPLRGIFERNRKNVVQIFYQVQKGRCYTWVLDEKGSLWREQQRWFDRSSYVAHWLYLMRNIRNRLKRINYQNRELPSIEIQHISSNQLGGLEFHSLGAESITSERGFIDIRITVQGDEGGDRISLNCDGREFSYQQYQQRAITECVQYMLARMASEGRKPVYVTDIDVPLRLYGVAERDAIQVSHFLKYKRNFERRLNQLIEA